MTSNNATAGERGLDDEVGLCVWLGHARPSVDDNGTATAAIADADTVATVEATLRTVVDGCGCEVVQMLSGPWHDTALGTVLVVVGARCDILSVLSALEELADDWGPIPTMFFAGPPRELTGTFEARLAAGHQP